NPNYWAMNASNIPAVAQPAHIPVIVIYYGLSHTDRVEDFDSNTAQISYVSVPFIGQMYSGYKYKGVPFSAIFKNFGATPGVYFISMNTLEYPTNITDFRLALEYAINYSALLHIYSFNGTTLAVEFLGPISPQFPIYNEVITMDHLHPYNYNLSLALHYLNEAGYEGHFYVVLPNGTIIGDPNGQQLPTLPITTIPPLTPFMQEELEIIMNDLEQIGVSTTVRLVAPSVIDSWNTPQSTALMADLAWFPDWPDPVYQQLVVQTDVEYGGIAGNFAWLNVSWINQLDTQLPFITNVTNQTLLVAKIYSYLYNYAPYIYLPYPDTYFFIQPYVAGFVYNSFVGYWYNMMYYTNYTYTTY
ncbi:MAG: ABC transporter substrate-binding protein, partial [Sulfolobaceae archaeon]|nr:ABC transporter substrate-binding protein [Sulfolobaceae archaeon]